MCPFVRGAAAGLLSLAVSPFAAMAAAFPLEWSTAYPVDVPWEVEVSPSRLARLTGHSADGGFAVLAETASGVKRLGLTVLEGRAPETVALRFTVPEGTRSLSCEMGGCRITPEPSGNADNIFAGVLDASSVGGWRLTNGGKAAPENGGVRFSSSRQGVVTVSRAVGVPQGLAGNPVFIEMDVENVAKLAFGSRIWIDQLDADGKILPEALSDPRWLSHLRPPRKLQRLREEGRLHPRARRLVFNMDMRSLDSRFDEFGLPVPDPSMKLPAIRLSKLAVRPAARLPFPKYNDSFFVQGVSKRSGDAAILLGGDRAFWYATHSHACWAQGKQTDRLEDVFYPDRAGTVEAWLKPGWGVESRRTYNIFTASHRYNSNQANDINPKNDAMTLKYDMSKGAFEFSLLDWKGKRFGGSAVCPFGAGDWHHVAVQWDPSSTADVYLDGRRILSLPLAGFEAWDLKRRTEVQPNGRIPLEFYIGANYTLGRIASGAVEDSPFFAGAVDCLRVSSVCRYSGSFAPADSFATDADTRALFSFDRSFDGVSGGGCGFISGTLFAKEDRIDHRLVADGREYDYFPAEILPENDPSKVFTVLNYPDLPSAEGFRFARRIVSRTFSMDSGDSVSLDCPQGTTPEYVEISNVGGCPLVYPALVNSGELDPRSFGDLSDSLMSGRGGLSDRERTDIVFQFLLGASDYYMQHTAYFPADSDKPWGVAYEALTMLNGYCGFECGPLNSVAANIFACVAGCPSSMTSGYGHSFQQVHFDGKNHTYDLSAQKFFTAFDNETPSCLGESEVQPYVYNRLGGNCGSFIRIFTRGFSAHNPVYREKVSLILNPGESFRVWQANDGRGNDIQFHIWQAGEVQARSCYREDYASRVHASIDDPAKCILPRMDRFFPHYLNGFIRFEGRPEASNPAFLNIAPDSFCYRVKSGYPIVHGEYSARSCDGREIPVEISTDGGRTYRAVSGPLSYEVRARHAYLVRVKAPIGSVKSFRASTEVTLNPRIFTGRVRPGGNRLLFKSVAPKALGLPDLGAAPAKVTVAWREDVKPVEVQGGVSTGVIPGLEKQVVFLDPSRPQELKVSGLSPSARIETFPLRGAAGGGAGRGPEAQLYGGSILLSAAKGEPEPSIGCLRIQDGGAVRDIYVVTSSGLRFANVSGSRTLGAARMVPAGSGQPQPSVMCRKRGDGVRFDFPPVQAGRYTVYMVDRFPSDMKDFADINRLLFSMDWPGRDPKMSVSACSGANQGVNFYKARYGKLEGRANFKWDYVLDGFRYSPYFPRYEPKVLAFGEGASYVSFNLNCEYARGAELCAVLLVPEMERDFVCELVKLLCGMNTDPARITD